MSTEQPRPRQSRGRPVTQTAMVEDLSRHKPGAWDDFYSTYWRWLLGVCLNMGIPHCDAEDLVQTTFIRVNENIGDFHYNRSRGRFSGWLVVILANLARDYWRRAQREGKRRVVQRPSNSSTQTQPLYRIASPQKDQVFNLVLAHELQRVFQEAYAELKTQVSPRHWAIFQAYAIEGRPAEEVADEFGAAVGTVCSIDSRLHGQLRPILARKLSL
jgi:RNA polymerase sigma-70 factor (ECF subfamily)